MTPLFLLLSRQDERVLHLLVLRRRRLLDRLLRSLTHLGDAAVTIPLVLLLMAGLVPELAETGRSAAFALVVSHGLVQVLKRTISRPRPRLPVGVCSLIEAPDRFSFPSGHAAASLSIALPLAAVLALPLAALVVALACIVGLSRCYLGVHYPGDVLVGWLLAALAVLAAAPVLGWLAI